MDIQNNAKRIEQLQKILEQGWQDSGNLGWQDSKRKEFEAKIYQPTQEDLNVLKTIAKNLDDQIEQHFKKVKTLESELEQLERQLNSL